MYKYTHLPQRIEKQEYEHQKRSFLKELDILLQWKEFSLYQIGELELYWVSDLDFLCIISNFSVQEKITQIAKKYSLIDNPLFFDTKNIQNISYFTHHMRYIYLLWKKLDDTIFEKKDTNLYIIYAWKVLFFSGLRNLYIPYFQKKVPIKKVLSWIYDIRYPIFFLSQITKIDPEIQNFIDEYSDFRTNWFTHQDTKKLTFFLEKSIDICWQLIDILEQQIILQWEKNKKIYGRFPTIFDTETNFKQYRTKTEKYFETISTQDRFLFLPPHMYYKYWNTDLKKSLYTIQKYNKNFLNFSFKEVYLKWALFIKKVLDFIKIAIYEKI